MRAYNYLAIVFVSSFVLLPTEMNAQWKQLNVGSAGRINAVAVFGSNVFAGTDAGVYRSTNNGASWTNVNSSFTLCFAATDSNIFAGTPSGVILSTNDGITWSPSGSIGWVDALTVKDTEIFAGTANGRGIFRSTDNGASWIAVNNGLGVCNPYDFFVDALAVSGNKIFAGTDAGFAYSIDDGDSWSCSLFSRVNCIAVNDSTIFMGTPGGMSRSTDDGVSWNDDNNGFNGSPSIFSVTVSNSYIYTGTTAGIFISTNDGVSWKVANNGLPSSPSQIFSVAVNDSNIFAATPSNGVFLSTNNGASWTPANTGIVGSEVNYMAGEGSNIFALMNLHSIFVSTDNGTTWATADSGLPSVIQSVAIKGSDVFAITNGGIFLSSDKGKSWSSVNGGIMDTTYPTLMAPCGSNLITATQRRGLYLSSDNGKNWGAITDSLPPWIASLATEGSEVFAGSHEGLYLSTDCGESWSKVNDTLININAWASSGTSIFAGRDTWPVPVWDPPVPGNIFHSVDNGENWAIFSYGLPEDPQVSQLVVHGSDIFAGLATAGLYTSRTDRDNWINVGTGLPVLSVLSLFVNDSNIFVGTSLGGIWQRSLSEVVKVDEPTHSVVPATFQLEQNYPNPFNPTTTIGYDIAERSKVTLVVYDILGRKVATLVKDVDTLPGHYDINFNASELSSGVYFYRLTAGNFVEIKKMMLLR